MFSIIELQTTNGVTTHIYNTAETKDQAMSIYHTTLSYAAVSQVEYHACIVMDEQGRYLARECYEHITPVEPETTEEPESEVE